MIDDDRAEKAVEFLRDNASLAGQLKANRIWLEESRKSRKAILMAQAAGKPLGEQERFAYSHEKYTEWLDKIREAVALDEENRAKREAAMMTIEVWRSQNANQRMLKI